MSYQQFIINSEKGAPLGEYISHDGTVRINLDEHWDYISDTFYSRTEGGLIELLLDTLIHEDNHKAISEAEYPDESFNEQQERVMRCIQDWVERGKMTAIVEYDWK